MQQRHHKIGFRVLRMRRGGAWRQEAASAPQEGAEASCPCDAAEQLALYGLAGSDAGLVSIQPENVDRVERRAVWHSVARESLRGPFGRQTGASAAPSNGHAPALLDLCAWPLIAACGIPKRAPADRKQIPNYIGCAVPAR